MKEFAFNIEHARRRDPVVPRTGVQMPFDHDQAMVYAGYINKIYAHVCKTEESGAVLELDDPFITLARGLNIVAAGDNGGELI